MWVALLPLSTPLFSPLRLYFHHLQPIFHHWPIFSIFYATYRPFLTLSEAFLLLISAQNLLNPSQSNNAIYE
uniref:Uncharacterized protein n=1 Tax=Magnetococcus massalia (strain MO-1) TaxID=451514 RepID=A0A1S7LJB1_MAGMO|nr:Protein of unknown function [Candidatus Magnetococcus massalia]